MLKKYLILMLTLACFAALLPQETAAATFYGTQAAEQTEPTIRIEGNTLTVSHADGLNLEIYTLTGSKTAAYVIEGEEVRIQTHLQKGWYILKLGTTVRKIAIR